MFLINTEKIFQDGKNVNDFKVNCIKLGKKYSVDLDPFQLSHELPRYEKNIQYRHISLGKPKDVLENIV